jgi:hypothetical protein
VSADDTGRPATPVEQPTLTHPQAVNRLQEIRDAMGQIAELERPSAEDDRYFAELRDEFDRTDAWRKHLEREAELERIRSTTSGLSGGPWSAARPGRVRQPSAASGDGYTATTFSTTRTVFRARPGSTEPVGPVGDAYVGP